MKRMLEWQGLSRQAAHKAIDRMYAGQDDVATAIELATQIRQLHPRMGCRDIYYACRDAMPRGRDWAEAVLMQSGFAVCRRSRSRTVAGGVVQADLIEGLVLTGPDQVWQTDLTWVWSGGRWRYVSFMVDVYTRQIIASHCSDDLSAASQVKCLKKALKARKGRSLQGLIIHTDRGSQYTAREYTAVLRKAGIRHSMAHFAWQNAYCERVNRTIKEGYLAFSDHRCLRSLRAAVSQSVTRYNTGKPHRGLPDRLSPQVFMKAQQQGEYADYTVKIFSRLTSTKRLFVN